MNFINKLRRRLGLDDLKLGEKSNIKLEKKSNLVFPKTGEVLELILFSGNRTQLKDKSINNYYQNLIDSNKILEKLLLEYKRNSKEKIERNERKLSLLKKKISNLEEERNTIQNEIEEIDNKKINYSKAEIKQNQPDDFKEELIDLIQNAKVKEVFQKLKSNKNLTVQSSEDLTLFMYEYTELENKESMGLITDDECRVNKNKIVRGLIILINRI